MRWNTRTKRRLWQVVTLVAFLMVAIGSLIVPLNMEFNAPEQIAINGSPNRDMTSLISFGVQVASAWANCKDDAWAESQLRLKVLGQDVSHDHCKWVYYDWNGPGDWVTLNRDWVGTLTQPSDKTPRVFFGSEPPIRMMVTGITARHIPSSNHRNLNHGNNIDYCGFLRSENAYGHTRNVPYDTLAGRIPAGGC